MAKSQTFRDYVESLRACGEIQEINQLVDWNLEIGAIIRRSYELPAAAPMFNNITDNPRGFRILGAPVGLSANKDRPLTRIALSVGLNAEATASEIMNQMARWSETDERRPVKIVDNAPCQENVFQGSDVDMFMFPTPLLHEGDGGRFFGTLSVVVLQTPDGKWTNWSVNRCMLHEDKDKLFVNFSGSKHASIIHRMWQKLNKPTPVAVLQGTDQLIMMLGGTPLADYVTEQEVLGAFLGEDVEVTRCKTIDLCVPASSEIVIEGYIGPSDYASEGPMGEYCGFLSVNASKPKPYMTVTAITHRNNAIIPACSAGYPAEENHTCWGTAIASNVLAELRRKGFPVTMCFVPFETCVQWLVVTISTNRTPDEDDINSSKFVREIGEAVFRTRGGKNIPKVIVVHDDIDPFNIVEVSWAFATRCHPGIGEIHLEHFEHNPLEISLHSDEVSPPIATKTVYNCLFQGRSPGANFRRSSFEHIFPVEVRQKVIANWNSYGYE